MEKLWKKRGRLALIGISLVTIVFSWVIYQFIALDYDFEKFFPQDDEDTEFYFSFREKFETDNDFVLVGIENENGIFDSTFLAEVDRFTHELEQLDNVVFVASPTNLMNSYKPVSDPFGAFIQDPFLHWQFPADYERDSTYIYNDPRLVGSYFSTDAKSLALMVKTKEYLDKDACEELTEDLVSLGATFSFDDLHIAGRAVAQTYYVDLMQTDFLFFMSTSMVLLVIFLGIAFRSFWGIWVPMSVVMLSIVWTIGVLTVSGGEINLILTVLPTIMFVVGISDVVHIVSRYLEELRQGETKIVALKKAYIEVGLATLLTSITTSIGFFTLLTSSVEPIRNFGLYTGIGVLLAYVLAFTLLPSVLVLRPKPRVTERAQHNTFWYRFLHRSLAFTLRNRIAILIFFIALGGVCTWMATQVTVNNYLLEDLNDSNELKQDFVYFENEFAGVRPFELAIWVKDTSKTVLDEDVALEMEKIQDYLETEYEVGNIMSPVSMYKTMNMAMKGGGHEYYELPEGKNFRRSRTLIKRYIQKDSIKGIADSTLTMARIQGKIADLGSKEFLERDAAFDEFMHEKIDTSMLGYRVTGTAFLVDKNNNFMASSMITGLVIAFIVISLIAGFFFKSMRIIPIALVPNVLPLLMIAAIMYIMQTDLKVTTSIIFTIAFGIAVDDTIHFMSKLRMEMNKGRSMLYALKRAYLSTGRAIIITTLILCAGFLTLIFSQFQGTYLIGVLISLTLFFAVLADLTILPVLLVLFYKNKKDQ